MPVVIPPGTALAGVEVENEVTYNIGGVVYAGKIRAITPDDLRPYGIGLDIDCQDFTSLLNDDLCVYMNIYADPVRTVVETDMQRISWLLQSWGRDGISAYNVQMLYASMPAQDFTGMTLTEAIKAVLAYSGGSFYVDFGKDLHTFIAESAVAPFGLSDSPDGVTSFGYADFQYPRDSVDLKNAVFVSGAAPTADVATVTESIATSGFPVNGAALVFATFKAATGRKVTPVTRGPFTAGAPTTVTPAFAATPAAGNFLVAWVTADNGEPTTAAAGWTRVVSEQANTGDWVSIWMKPNCGAGETAPTFTNAGGLVTMFAQVAEFQSVATSAPIDQAGRVNPGGGQETLTATAAAADLAAGNLIVTASVWRYTSNAAAAFSTSINAGKVTITHVGDYPAGDLATDASFNYALPSSGQWYTDEASIAKYRRREAVLSDKTVTSQAGLDALGAAYLAAHANPLRQASCHVDQPGLAAGQVVPVTNALHGLSAQPFRIQRVETTYSENVPRFAVEFADPTVDLTSQLRSLQDDVTAGDRSSPSAAVTAGPRGTLDYAEVVATQGVFTAVTDITGLVSTVTVAAGRRIRVTCQIGGSSSIAGDLIGAYIREGASTLQQDQFAATLAATAYMSNFDVVLQPSAGSHTYKISMARVSGTGNITMQAGATFPASITVDDIGAS